jgi:ATP adenylyltransferase
MKSLWAPWRFPYLKGKKPDYCIFCLGSHLQDRDRYILHRGRSSYVIMNAYPYSNGHLMVAPYRHLQGLDKLSRSALGDLLATTQLAISVLKTIYKPEGFNVGINIGKAAGAGIEEHLHLHVVPRWNGDTNFMSSVSDLRVIPEGLRHAYDQLRPAFRKLTAGRSGRRLPKRQGRRAATGRKK